jgi:hypothetical protein
MNKKSIQDQIQEDLKRHSQEHPFDLINNKGMCSFHAREFLLDCFPFIEEESTCSEFNIPKSIQQYTDMLKENRP